MSAYKRVASWAVWETSAVGEIAETATFPLQQARDMVHGRAMIISLNPGSDRTAETEATPDWSNFHSPLAKHNDLFLARAFLDTKLWGAYMADLHPGLAQSDSREVRLRSDVLNDLLDSLIQQAKLLGQVEMIVAVGKASYTAIGRHWPLIERELGTRTRLIGIPHYSRANARVHGQDAGRYRQQVVTQLASAAT